VVEVDGAFMQGFTRVFEDWGNVFLVVCARPENLAIALEADFLQRQVEEQKAEGAQCP
jgi:hypothetical protein